MDMVKNISGLLPQIRGNGLEEKALADLLAGIYTSPFSPGNLTAYVKNKIKESQLFASYLKCLVMPQILLIVTPLLKIASLH